jgi:PAS domain S-box-containing protein
MTDDIRVSQFPRSRPVRGEAETLRIEPESGHDTDEASRRNSIALRLALDTGRLGSWEQDLLTNEFVINATCKAHLGLEPDEQLTLERLQALKHPGDVRRIEQAIAYALATRSDYHVEYRVIRPGGRIGRVLVRGAAIYKDGIPIRMIGVTQDITERERAREEFQDNKRRQEFLLKLNDQLRSFEDPLEIMEATAQSLGQLLNIDSAGYGEVDEGRGVVLVEREWSRGAISNEGRAYRLQDFMHGVSDAFEQGYAHAIEDVRADAHGSDPALQNFYSTINARAVLTVPLFKNGRLTALLYVTSYTPRAWSSDDLSLAEDVAERTWTAVEKARAEQNLRDNEARFRLIAESMPGVLFVYDKNLSLIYINERWTEVTGMPTAQALGKGWEAAYHPDDLIKFFEDAKLNRADGDFWQGEVRYKLPNGSYRWHLCRVGSLFGPHGEYQGKVGTAVDIHDMKETTEALLVSEERLAMAQRTAGIGVFDWNVAADKIYWTTEQEQLFGIAPGSFEGNYQGWTSRVHPDDVAVFEKNFAVAIASGDRELSFAYRIILQEGSYRYIEGSITILYDASGKPERVIGVNIDVTKHKQAEERQQLLIRELHHRVKNTLATVQAIVGSTARTALSIDEFYQGFVGRIVSLARTHNLLTEELWQKASLEDLVQTELGPYEDEARNRILVEGPHVELPSEAAVPIGMAIHELTTNAAKHGALSTFGGQVAVKWTVEEGEAGTLLHFTWEENGGPKVSAPIRQGFGSRLLQRVLTTQLQAEVTIDFKKENLHFAMTLPIPGDTPLFNPGQ